MKKNQKIKKGGHNTIRAKKPRKSFLERVSCIGNIYVASCQLPVGRFQLI